MPETDANVRERDNLSPFHAGERQAQERLGDRGVERWARGAIRSFMPDQHRIFFEEQPFLIAAARDAEGRTWATFLEGGPGFVRSPDSVSLEISARPVPGDALDGALAAGSDIGLIGIEPATRRRNRVNGTVAAGDEGGIRFAVSQSFGNCPQYIRARRCWWSPEQPTGTAVRGTYLTASQQEWITSADTFFIATGYRGEGDNPAYGMDISHRGGERGFIEVLDDRTICFPDYAGNRFYNTLGNILSDPRAGLLFVDFASGSLLQLTGRASIDWDSEAVARVPGARQLVTLEIDAIVELSSVLRLRWQEDAAPARSLRLVERVQESADVTSFIFEARDGGPLKTFAAGQHLPIELNLSGGMGKVQRSYSLSGAPRDGRYRISVKRDPQGLVSRILHDGLHVGAMIDAGMPAGTFGLSNTRDPIVLVSAGIGITPLLSMLHAVAGEGDSRPVWFVHGARDGAHHPFRDEVRALAAGKPSIRLLTHYSHPLETDVRSRDYDHAGRITAEGLVALTGAANARFYLCGPAGFLAELKAGLEREGIPDSRILEESF
ncbi:pyridoxamine 5'-phosphate oxidase family protein [Roseibium sp.]|uniref:pyridoxamine 5'-phosphate oxidase family protein n=1 Tax=Roseibium sp. TaxID=1936156 RepID=UPI003D09DB49